MNNRPKPSMVVRGITRKTEGGYTELSARVDCAPAGMKDTRIWYRVPEQYGEYVTERADPFMASMLLPAMFYKCPLVIEGAVSEELLSHCSQVMKIFEGWLFEYHAVEIIPSKVVSDYNREGTVGCFFSGGVDSFFTVLRNLEREKGENRIQYLLHVHQEEASNSNNDILRNAEYRLSQVSESTGLTPLLIKTNLKAAAPHGVNWGLYHGPVYASTALALDLFFRKVYIASSNTYARVTVWGTQPMLDPLWSNGSVELIHCGCEKNRVQRIVQYISRSETALKHLQVCLWKDSVNCCRCQKCLTTMLMLDMAGVLEKAETFPEPIDYGLVNRLDVKSRVNMYYINDILEAFRGESESKRSYQTVLKLKRRMRKYEWLYRLKRRDLRYYSEWAGHIRNNIFPKMIGGKERRPPVPTVGGNLTIRGKGIRERAMP